ncbi:hypothetical protein CO173_00935 [Candidatus Uhrbacteria bacterium CG_4_9_14_3_um_filter_41_35]|uniref:Glycosyl transferase family 1 domain-containing protein n=1 Tax=Candidatus Uhrbacteria bacterium CG_4_9_14_3_um_filter_41_35 TaxID=1975034 RepID=A0A2M7XGD8_9BACT|nr:MAG: hypothetical protein COV92_03740 [Candidatus Uhrbacteria bacterium CG11_big_fil_rev_8_21_14_0_20_41_9]PJA46937.1 MAG: hypothetical protein CO173_00935 [Candidatus Uhrbacteria bacterium CG_4_9_14_3_um_filter_41_35]
MKIGVDIRHLAGGDLSGVGYYTVNIIKEMSKLAPNDEFILFASGTASALKKVPQFSESNIKVVKKDLPNKIVSTYMKSPYGPALEDFLDEKITAWFFPNINMIRTKLPYALTMHDVSFRTMPEFFTKKTKVWHRLANVKKLLNDAQIIFSVSGSTNTDLQNIWRINSNKITITHLGVSENYNSQLSSADKNYLRTYKINFPYFLTLSTLEPRKNIESVIEAYEIFCENSKQNPSPHLIIAGGSGWKTEEIIRLARTSKFKNNIHLIGYVADKHKPALYRNANIFLFPSFYEGFGLPVLEAMACGTPVITSFTGSMPEVVEDSAILIDPYNVSDIVMALGILNDSELRSELIDKGKKQSAKFTWHKTAEQTLDNLRKLG